eukprot:TRINITY_DN2219_c1_g5_i1.p1 TRINITY_DN2219_c1_g5~~TRINITY_DN2219_c1_g5_i1.p1  ORF type:complete len:272 (-),score=52.81 TRINITY_DN2219_c1_g5_i1:24-770(-)
MKSLLLGLLLLLFSVQLNCQITDSIFSSDSSTFSSSDSSSDSTSSSSSSSSSTNSTYSYISYTPGVTSFFQGITTFTSDLGHFVPGITSLRSSFGYFSTIFNFSEETDDDDLGIDGYTKGITSLSSEFPSKYFTPGLTTLIGDADSPSSSGDYFSLSVLPTLKPIYLDGQYYRDTEDDNDDNDDVDSYTFEKPTISFIPSSEFIVQLPPYSLFRISSPNRETLTINDSNPLVVNLLVFIFALFFVVFC